MKLRAVIVAGLIAGTTGLAVPAQASAAAPLLLQSRSDQLAVVRSFRTVLNRNPTAVELRRYALLMDEYGWSEHDVRRDLQERSDYRR